MHPEKILLRSVHRFLAGSARIVEDFRIRQPRQQQHARKRRKRVFETAILPISAQLLSIEKNLDYELFPDNTPEKVRHLVDSLQAVRLRMQTLETAYTTAANESPELMKSLESIDGKWRNYVSDTLRHWSRPGHRENRVRLQDSTISMSEEVERKLDKLQSDTDPGSIDKQGLRNVYAVVGSTQSLLDAMQELGENMQQINWQQWSVARF